MIAPTLVPELEEKLEEPELVVVVVAAAAVVVVAFEPTAFV